MIEQIAANLWVQQSAWFDINSGIFVSDNQALFIDPGLTPGEVASLRNFAIGNGWQIVGIFLTHWHWDHIVGPERLPNVPIYGPPFYDEVLEPDHRAKTLAALAAWEQEAGISRSKPFLIPKLDKAFGDGDILCVGDAQLQIVHVPGHCKGQAALFEKVSGLFWSADNLIDFEVPFVMHNSAAFIETLERLKRLNIQHLVPGHASPTQDSQEINRRFANSLAYLHEARAFVAQALAEGRDAEATIEQGLKALVVDNPDAVHPHRQNIGQVYLELGGSAGSEEIGW